MQDDSASTSPALDTTTKSRELTRSLLSLDLGYSVLNEELMRRSVGVDVDRLDALPDDDDGIDGSSDAEGEEFFETLPQPQHLGRLSAERAGERTCSGVRTERFIAVGSSFLAQVAFSKADP